MPLTSVMQHRYAYRLAISTKQEAVVGNLRHSQEFNLLRVSDGLDSRQ